MTDHSSISKLKNEAKKLKKQNNLSLMQAQTIVAKKNGYNSWHDFLQKIKNVFVPEQKYNPWEKPPEVTSKSIDDVPKDGFFHIGQEKGLEHWLTWEQSRCHMHIVEEYSSIYSMDIYVAKQAILQQQPVLFSSTDVESAKVLINFAVSNNRRNIFLFDTNEQLYDFSQYKNHRLSLRDYNAGSLSQLLSSYYKDVGLGDNYKNEFLHFLHLVSSITVYQKEYENVYTTLDSILNNGNYETLKKYAELFPVEHDAKQHLVNAVKTFASNIEKINLFKQNFLSIIEKIKATNIFNNNNKEFSEINFDSLYYKQEDYPIFIFLTSKSQLPQDIASDGINNYSDLVNLTVLIYYTKLVQSVLGRPIENRNDFEYKKRTKNDSIAFVMRNPPLYGTPSYNWGSLAAQNRAIGSSFIFTFNSLPHSYSIELESLLANANTYFFGKSVGQINNNYTMKNLFDKKLSQHLMDQAYFSKTIICEYKSDDIENLQTDEYIVFNKNKLMKVKIN